QRLRSSALSSVRSSFELSSRRGGTLKLLTQPEKNLANRGSGLARTGAPGSPHFSYNLFEGEIGMLKAVSICSVVFLAAASVSFAAGVSGKAVQGNYIEARTADVFTGACFANGEAEQVGREAVFGWQIQQGNWHGVDVSGLSVVGVIRTEHTIGL